MMDSMKLSIQINKKGPDKEIMFCVTMWNKQDVRRTQKGLTVEIAECWDFGQSYETGPVPTNQLEKTDYFEL